METKIYKKIADIIKAKPYVQKTGYNSFHKYKYATEADILATLRDEFIRVGLIYTMSVKTSQQIGEFTNIMAEFKVIDPDSGEFITLDFSGQGQDKGDKGMYKAFTGCQKYFLAKNFMIETGDDPERDEEQHGKETPRPPVTGESISKGLANVTSPKADKKQIEVLKGLYEQAGITPDKGKPMLVGLFFKEKTGDLTSAEATQLICWLKEAHEGRCNIKKDDAGVILRFEYPPEKEGK